MALYPGTPYDYSAEAHGLVFTAGACPLDEHGRVVAPGDFERQARLAVENLLAALTRHSVGPESLVKTTVFVVARDRSDLVSVWEVVSARLGAAPSTLLGVSFLGYPDQLVEIEAVAVSESALAFRTARVDEGPALTELALRAKAHWGYDEEFLQGARAALTIDDDTIRCAKLSVLERAGVVIGFFGLVDSPPVGRLEWMSLEPSLIGRGYGRLMFNEATRQAQVLGFSRLRIESDRFAEPFYLAMGAERVSATPSPVDGSPLPLLELQLRPRP